MKIIKITIKYIIPILLIICVSYITINHYHAYRFRASVTEAIQNELNKNISIKDISYTLEFPVPTGVCGIKFFKFENNYFDAKLGDSSSLNNEASSLFKTDWVSLPFYPSLNHFYQVRKRIIEGNERCSTWRNVRKGRPQNAILTINISNKETNETKTAAVYWWDVKKMKFIQP